MYEVGIVLFFELVGPGLEGADCWDRVGGGGSVNWWRRGLFRRRRLMARSTSRIFEEIHLRLDMVTYLLLTTGKMKGVESAYPKHSRIRGPRNDRMGLCRTTHTRYSERE